MSCRCGPHYSLKSTLLETVQQCKSNEKTCQCFLGGPTRYDTRDVPRTDIETTREYLKNRDMKLYVHAPYVINLAREGDDTIVEKSKKSLQKIVNTLYEVGPEYTGTIVHTGAKGSISSLCGVLNDMDLKMPVLMENCAEASKLGKNMDELRLIVEGTDSRNIGICIDTCHSFASGMTDYRESSAVEKFFEDMSAFDNRQVIFHINDSLTEFGGKSDRHAPIRYGHIWNLNRPDSIESLQRFYELTRMGCHDCIFETPNPVSSVFEADMLTSY